MTPLTAPRELQLRRIVWRLQHSARLLAFAIVIGAIIGVAVAAFQPREAVTDIQIGRVAELQGGRVVEKPLESAQNVIRYVSNAVGLHLVVSEGDRVTAQALVDDANASIVRIVATSRTTGRAQELVRAAARQVLDLHTKLYDRVVGPQLQYRDTLKARITSLSTSLDTTAELAKRALTDQSSTVPLLFYAVQQEQQVRSLTDLQRELRDVEIILNATETTTVVRETSSATVAGTQPGKFIRVSLLGALGGLMIAVLLLVGLEGVREVARETAEAA